MTLRFHNTLTRRKEEFSPFDSANVRVYACGPTVYDHLHIGNGRMLIVFDVLFRLLRHVYGERHVTYVRNITDVDDKINARAAERGIPIRSLTDDMIAIFHDDAAALGCLPPTIEPRATDHMVEMVAIMQRLVANGHAYAADGHVLFDVSSMPDYGRLANKSLDEQIAGARVDVAPYKRSATDFVLWKPAAAGEPGWDSPWGRGRPGWHLECSAMSWRHLGETFDIHGGGIDLVFPHHENEIAQSRCAFGHGLMAQVWMHNGHLQVEGEKMSKSLGNFVTIRDLWASARFGNGAWAGDVLRVAMLKTHYRDPIDWTVKRLIESKRDLEIWTENVAVHDLQDSDLSELVLPPSFIDFMSDDLNTAGALAVARDFSKTASRNRENAIALASMLSFLGIKNIRKPGFFRAGFDLQLFESGPQPDLADAHQASIAQSLLASGFEYESVSIKNMLKEKGFYLKINDAGVASLSNATGAEFAKKSSEFERQVHYLISLRNEARAAKDWKESDRLRAELADLGISVKDNKDGTTTWERERKPS